MASVEETIGKIQVLPEAVSSRIAAGEVVERPAAVVKELLDNSLDADSTLIAVEVEDGGKRVIRVTDNGEGMSRVDAQRACHRFATSKLRSEHDLCGIATLGFRGEALPSIASVSQFRLLTVCHREVVGTQVLIEGGGQSKIEDRPGSIGTQVEAANLFFNTPGRQKFLKSAATEFSHVCHVVQQAALAWPETHFRLTHNDHAVLDYPAVASRPDRLLQVYGSQFIDNGLLVHLERPGLRVEGLTSNPFYTRTRRTPQDIFVNRRFVKNTTISHAVYEAYGSFLPKGRHPVFTLFLQIDPAHVDVNVHPAKREVKFSDQAWIHRTVMEAIRSLLQQTAYRETESRGSEETWSPSLRYGASDGRSPEPSKSKYPKSADAPAQSATRSTRHPDRGGDETIPMPIVEEAEQQYFLDEAQEVIPLGQVNKTFLVAQVGAELQVVDQHTAHERVLFERLWRSWDEGSLQTQPLLIPEPIEVPLHEADRLEQHVEELAKLGLELGRFGRTAFVIRAVPSMLGQINYALLVQDLVEDLSEWKSMASLDMKIRAVLASLACRGAVQAGRVMQEPEIKQLMMDWVQEGCPMTCPHGRRVALRFSSEELNQIFGRA